MSTVEKGIELDDDVEIDEYENDEEWMDMNGQSEEQVEMHPLSTCLLCKQTINTASEWLDHLLQQHQCNFADVIEKLSLKNFYDYVKFVNYARKHSLTSFSHLIGPSGDWNDEEYLLPHTPNDGLLTLDFAELCRLSNVNAPVATAQNASEPVVQSQALPYTSESMLLKSEVNGRGDVESDNYYFESYGSIDIHADMLGDVVRTSSYQKFILENAHEVIKGRVVLDVGCGTGILSMFAAEAGAKKVIAVDNSDIIYDAMGIALENGFDKEIEFVHGRLEELTLSCNKVDVLISEWMGYFLFYERMLDTVLYARDHILTNPKHIYPRCYTLNLVACSDIEFRQKSLDCWLSQYGYRMPSLWERRISEPQIDICSSESIVSSAACVSSLDLATAKKEDQEFQSHFTLTIHQANTKLTHLVAYFDVNFSPEVPHSVTFSTGPAATPTHWKQTIFWLKECVSLTEGDVVRGVLTVKNVPTSRRSLQIELAFTEPFELRQSYSMH